MYKKNKYQKSSIKSVEKLEGEPIEVKIERIVNNGEPIKDGAPEIYTERKEGVIAAYNIKTDRFEIACEAMDKVEKSVTAKREERYKEESNSNSDKKEKEKSKEIEKGKVIKIDEVKPVQGNGTKEGEI